MFSCVNFFSSSSFFPAFFLSLNFQSLKFLMMILFWLITTSYFKNIVDGLVDIIGNAEDNPEHD